VRVFKRYNSWGDRGLEPSREREMRKNETWEREINRGNM
jgi:hypothetical protein